MLAEGIRRTGTEAQWTLFDPSPSAYWAKRYLQDGVPVHREAHLAHMGRSLSQFVRSRDGRLLLPELRYSEYDDEQQKNLWIPNEHTPLLMAQANFLRSLKYFEAVMR